MDNISEELSACIDLILELKKSFAMYKPIYGNYDRTNEEDYCFYNEMEWRYICPDTNNEISPFIICDSLGSNVIDRLNELYRKNFQIEYSYDDIDFILCPKESCFEEILRELKVSEEDRLNISQKFKTLQDIL